MVFMISILSSKHQHPGKLGIGEETIILSSGFCGLIRSKISIEAFNTLPGDLRSSSRLLIGEPWEDQSLSLAESSPSREHTIVSRYVG